MGQIIAILGVLLALAALASYWVLKLRKGAILEITNKVQDKTIDVQHKQIQVSTDAPKSLDELDKQLESGEPL